MDDFMKLLFLLIVGLSAVCFLLVVGFVTDKIVQFFNRKHPGYLTNQLTETMKSGSCIETGIIRKDKGINHNKKLEQKSYFPVNYRCRQ